MQVLAWLTSLPSLEPLLTEGDSCGSSPLMEAARANTEAHLDCVRLLSDLNLDQFSSRDKAGRTVIQVRNVVIQTETQSLTIRWRPRQELWTP